MELKPIEEYEDQLQGMLDYAGSITDEKKAELTANYLAHQQRKLNKEARDYLASTDWYITRQSETGVVVPTDIVTKRAEARAAVVSVA
jgi:hypothetical protein